MPELISNRLASSAEGISGKLGKRRCSLLSKKLRNFSRSSLSPVHSIVSIVPFHTSRSPDAKMRSSPQNMGRKAHRLSAVPPKIARESPAPLIRINAHTTSGSPPEDSRAAPASVRGALAANARLSAAAFTVDPFTVQIHIKYIPWHAGSQPQRVFLLTSHQTEKPDFGNFDCSAKADDAAISSNSSRHSPKCSAGAACTKIANASE